MLSDLLPLINLFKLSNPNRSIMRMIINIQIMLFSILNQIIQGRRINRQKTVLEFLIKIPQIGLIIKFNLFLLSCCLSIKINKSKAVNLDIVI